MSTDLEWEIRNTARDLIKLYIALEEAKHGQPSPKEVRVMRPTPGPSSPGNWLWMHRGVEMSQRLQEVAFNAFGDLGKKIEEKDSGTLPLLDLIALNAQPISELPWSADFLDELTHQARKLGRWLNPPDMQDMIHRPEPRQLSEVILQKLNREGITLSPVTLRTWAAKGHITSEMRGNRATYLASEVIAHINRKEEHDADIDADAES